MKADYISEEQREAFNRRQRDAARWELTFLQIQLLPTTTNCPPEELLP